jgi:hypothetical protein
MSYTEREIDKVRRERDRLAQKIAEKDDEIKREREYSASAERRRIAASGQVTRLKNQAARGECPCCAKRFTNLWAHMRSEHKGFLADPVDSEALMIEGPK